MEVKVRPLRLIARTDFDRKTKLLTRRKREYVRTNVRTYERNIELLSRNFSRILIYPAEVLDP